ncbi:hypothetical protein ACP70R_021090 [Stipagrostis hirtigluma subsp. patula]
MPHPQDYSYILASKEMTKTDTNPLHRPHHVYAGPKCYMDASIPVEAQIAGPTPAGLGLHIQSNDGHATQIFIKAQPATGD